MVMKSTNQRNKTRLTAVAAAFLIAWLAGGVLAERPGWESRQVDWRTTGGGRIKAVHYPRHTPPAMQATRPKNQCRKKVLPQDAAFRLTLLNNQSLAPVMANVIDSPPIDGFVPWVAVAVTDERSEPGELEAITQTSVVGSFLTGSPETDYAIGIYDTGASAHIIGNAAANQAGLSGQFVTSNPITISGVTGSTEAWVSQPIGIFIDGLGAIDSSGLLTDTSAMVGQSNVAIAVGQGFSPVDLPTVIGSPLSVYFTAVFYNDIPITVTRDGNDYTSPDIRIYQQDDPGIPTYPNTIPLELRPLGGLSVQYLFGIDENFEITPTSPSVIFGNLLNPTQSIFFVASVDLYNGNKSAIDKDRFLFDTGAQITVVGSRVGARLALNPNNPDFEVEIQGVTGDTITAPGFYIDTIDIPALGDWLSFTNSPVILLDIPSPEGGTADGVIGMNLFVDLNFVLRGGGLFLQDDPAVEYEPINRLIGDIAPTGGDGKVDYLDIAAMADAWLANPLSLNWNARADLFGDAIINFRDLAILSQNWLQTGNP
jgi:predicted aspartyl protease